LVLDDGPVGENSLETVNLSLSAPVGATLDDPSSATLYIYEEDNSSSAPVANYDSYTVPYATPLQVDAASGVLANDTDPNNLPLSAVLVSNPANGSVTLNSDGSFTYTPGAGFYGTDSFSYDAFNGTSYSDSAQVTLTVTGPPPVANNDTYGIHPNTSLNVAAPGVLRNDSDPSGGGLSAALVSGTANGSLTLNSDGSFTYVPGAGFTGDYSFSYYASANSILSATAAVVTLHVAGVTLQMPRGPWVPINANDDNGSVVTNMIPTTRDYNFQGQLPNGRTDPQLQPLTITVANPSPLGFVTPQVQQNAGATG
jgi:hypothetical protein